MHLSRHARARHLHLIAAAAALAMASAGCGDEKAPSTDDVVPVDTLDDAGGDTSAADVDEDTSLADTTTADTAVDSTGDDTAADAEDLDDTAADAEDLDDTADAPDMEEMFGRTLADYRTCTTDNDCPVGLGVCVTEVPLNRTDPSGATTVQLSAIFTDLAQGEGVCSRICTNSDAECSSLTVNGNTPDQEPWVCQTVYTGTAPYPTPAPTAFPFDDQLDASELEQGVTFAAICRPPFQLDESVDRGLCGECIVGTNECAGSSTCWNSLMRRPAETGEAGFCLAPCGAVDDACPMGFVCTAMTVDQAALGDFCWPIENTCTSCLDRDEDGFGEGRCGTAVAPVTDVDCDDRNPAAYHNADNPNHPFPTHCETGNDFNCNGLDDEQEQTGTPDFGNTHCLSCGDTCSGMVPQASKSCATGTCQALCSDPLAFADCDGDIENGCEVAVDDTSVLWYPDLDGDGHGDMNAVPEFACQAGSAPAGYVQDASDCNDDPNNGGASVYGASAVGSAAPEICDGLDNDCDANTDDGVDETWFGDACDGNDTDQCAEGTELCSNAVRACSDDDTDHDVELCDNLDNDCDGTTNEYQDITSSTPGAQPFYVDSDGDGYGKVNSVPEYACSKPPGFASVATDCNDDPNIGGPDVYPGNPDVCDGLDNDCNAATADGSADTLNIGGTTFQLGDACDGADSDLCTEGVIACNASTDSLFCNDTTGNTLEVCDTTNTDEDCDGGANDSDPEGPSNPTTYYEDNDGDGWGGNVSTQACGKPSGYTANPGDCNDTPSSGVNINPGATEVCNHTNDDCDSKTDEGCPDGTIDRGSYQVASWAGADSGGSVSTYNCPGNEVLIGFQAQSRRLAGFCQSDAGVYGVAALCGIPRVLEDGVTAQQTINYIMNTYSIGAGTSYGSFQGAVGTCGDTISWTDLNCPDKTNGHYVTGVEVNTLNGRIKRFGGRCKPVTISSTNFGLTFGAQENTTIVPDNGTTGTDDNVNCPSNTVAMGFKARVSGGEFVGIQLHCAPLSVDKISP